MGTIPSQYYDLERPEILGLIPETARTILDVGCGTGALGAAIKRRQKAVVHGIEVFPDAAAVAAERLDQVWAKPVEACVSDVPVEH